MINKYIGIIICSALVVVIWVTLSDDGSLEQSQITQTAQNVTASTSSKDWTFATASAAKPTKSELSPHEALFTEAIKEQMADISDAFEENMRFPNYSKPLSENNWTLLNPRAFVPKAMPLAGLKNTGVKIIIPRFIVTRDESFPVTVKVISSGENAPQVQTLVLSISKKQYELPLKTSSSTNNESEFSAFVSKSLLKSIEETEVIISANIMFNNLKEASVSSVFKLVGNEVVLEDLSSSYVDGADLVIPGNFSVDISGHYRVQANLFDKASLTPISHLNNTFQLDSGSETGLLKVHAETLRSKGFAGPYILKDFNITRSPSAPGELTGYGTSKSESYDIQGFDLDSYSREKYEDKSSQQRLQFLQKMAGIED
jgi:hypothetical protein